jgi:tripartite-type tricarboxylate transporter receptor subunit TctC
MFMRTVAACFFLATGLICNGAAAADDQSDLLPGGRMTIIVGFSAGGGFDLYARLLARHIGRHLPGTPAVVVSNQPGAGSIKAAENILNIAPRDGTVIGLFGRTVPFAPLMSDRKFDGTRFEWVGSITEEVSTCVASSKSKVQSWKDMLDREFVVGGEGKDSDLDINANLLKNIFGAKIKLVSGYPGSTDVKLAIQRGEVDGICGLSYSTFKSNYATERREKSVNVLLQVSLKRHPELGEVPFVGDFATADQMSALRLLLEPQAMARPFAAPPGISKDRLRTLQAAFDRTMKDPAFLEDAQNIHLDVAPMRGEDVKALVSSLYSLPQEARDKARIATGG